jgi:hypothetical protein
VQTPKAINGLFCLFVYCSFASTLLATNNLAKTVDG